MAERCLSCMQPMEDGVCPHCGWPEKAASLPHQLGVGTVLRDRYQIGRVLGQGGFGITYLAWDQLMQKCVAIKEFFPSGTVQRNCAVTTRVECVYTTAVAAYAKSTERFLREAQALVQFREIPQVVDIQDFVKENNTAYIVMEYVKGVDLAKYVYAKGGRLSVEETFRILRPVMEALAKVHKGGIVHRDISPDNIILDPLGGAKLLDFGAVRAVENPDAEKALEKSTEAILKHGFAPIEQYNSRGSLGPWTDVYAMCATVWYCLTGRIPEEASIRVTEGSDPDWASIPGLSPVQQMALARGIACRPKERYPDMDSLLAALFPAAQPEFPKTENVPAPRPEKKPAAKPEKKIEKKAPKTPPVPREKKPAGKKPKWLLIAAPVAAAAVLALLLIPRLPAARYSKADALLESGDYARAAALFADLEGYEDSARKALRCGYLQGQTLLEQGSYQEAYEAFAALGSYSDSADMANRSRYAQALELKDQGRLEEAAELFAALGSFEDSLQCYRQCRNELDYPQALLLMERGDYAGAAALLEPMGDYRDSLEKLALCRSALDYEQALTYRAEGRYYDAAALFYSAGDYEDARQLCFACWDEIAGRETLVAGAYSAAAVHTDGTVTVVGLFVEGVTEAASTWQDVIALSGQGTYLMGLKADGTVVMDEQFAKECGMEAVFQWRDIVAISADYRFCVGLKADGTLVAAGEFGRYQWIPEMQTSQWMTYDLPAWTDVVDISLSGDTLAALKADGTVVLAGYTAYSDYDSNSDSYVAVPFDVSGWTDIVDVCVFDDCVVGIKSDGTVVVDGGANDAYGMHNVDVSDWQDIVAISVSSFHLVGLKSDGTAVITGTGASALAGIQGWTDIRAICAASGYKPDMVFTLGVKADGTVVLVGSDMDGRWKFATLKDVLLPR